MKFKAALRLLKLLLAFGQPLIWATCAITFVVALLLLLNVFFLKGNRESKEPALCPTIHAYAEQSAVINRATGESSLFVALPAAHSHEPPA